MPIERNIYCTFQLESAAYTNGDPQQYSTFLSFDCIGDDEAVAKAAMRAFLESQKEMKFAFYLLQPQADGVFAATDRQLAEDVYPNAMSEPLSDATDRLMNWLKGRGENRDPFWAVPKLQEDFDANDLGAGAALKSARSWPAPLPQQHGLVRVFRPENELVKKADHLWVLLPFLGEPPEPTELVNLTGTVQTGVLNYPFAPGQSIKAHVSMLEDPATQLTVDTVDANTGFLPLTSLSMDMVRELETYDENAASIDGMGNLFMDPALHEMAQAVVSEIQTPFRTQISRYERSPLEAAQNLHWLVQASAAALVDPIAMTLCQPGISSGDGSDEDPVEGPILSNLVDALELTIQQVGDEPIEPEATKTHWDAVESDIRNGETITFVRQALDDGQRLCRPIINQGEGTQSLSGVLDLKADPELPLDASKQQIAQNTTIIGTFRKLLLLEAGAATEATFDKIESDLWIAKIGPLSEDEKPPLPYPRTGYVIATALTDLAVQIQSENGMEAAMLRFITGGDEDGFINKLHSLMDAVSLSKAADANAKTFVTQNLRESIRIAFDAFKTLMESDFNGAAAANRAVSSLFSWALSHGTNGQLPKKEEISTILDEASFLNARWTEVAPPAFPSANAQYNALAKALWRPASKPHSDLLDSLIRQRARSIAAVFKPKRFQPDNRPMPLPIQLAGSGSQQKVHAFNEAFSGLGVLIKPSHLEEKAWACANLTTVEFQEKPIAPQIAQVSPLRPIVNDGLVRSVIGYEGLPFSSTAYSDTMLAGMAEEVPAAFESYGVEEDFVGTGSDPDYPKPPPLAYGVSYDLAEFALSVTGRPPHKIVDDSGDFPALGKTAAPNITTGTPDKVVTTDYQRRTMIGRASLLPIDGKTRIDHIPEDVRPLARDFRRTVVLPDNFIDLGRSDQGVGLLDRIGLKKAHVALTRLIRGENTILKLAVFDDPQALPFDTSTSTIIIDVSDIKSLKIKYIEKGDKLTVEVTGGNRRELEMPADPFWLRVSVEGDHPVSFDTPDQLQQVGVDRASNEKTPLLLIAPPEDKFPEKYFKSTKLRLNFPRTTFEDFRRWITNPKLSKPNGWVEYGQDAPRDDHRDLLYKAHFARAALEGLSDKLDRLPDPAVSHIVVDLTVTDALSETQVGHVSKKIRVPNLPALPEPPSGGESILQHLLDWLTGIDKALNMPVEVSCGEDLDLSVEGNKLLVSVPSGTVARLRVRNVVDAEWFREEDGRPAALHEDLMQLASAGSHAPGLNDDPLLFDGDVLLIEAMSSNMSAELATDLNDIICIDTGTSERSYQILAKNVSSDEIAPFNRWRHVGKILIETQRWTPSGVPIVAWINPVRSGQTLTSPAVDIGKAMQAMRLSAEEIDDFEKDAFFDRGDLDALSETVVLEHGDKPCLLKTASWQEPSASYFRHSCTAISRYRGAIDKSKRKEVQVRNAAVRDEVIWQLRIAMLANGSQVDMTRPQQRALVPLSRPLKGKAMPVAAIMQEPPYAVGGLAERLVAEIETGVGYKMEDKVLKIDDLRKEVGPDPRLRQTAFDGKDTASVVLDVDGPIGLTLGSAAARDFVSSSYTLTPRDTAGQLDNPDFEEAFLKARSQRYLHPSWVFDPVQGSDADAGKALLFQTSAKPMELIADNKAAAKKSTCLWMEVTADKKQLEFKTDASLIREAEPHGTEVSICKTPVIDSDGFELIVIPDDGQALRVLIMRKETSGRVVALASIRLRADAGANYFISQANTVAPALTEDQIIKGRPCIISEPTFAQWARTSRDFEKLHSKELNGTEWSDLPSNQLEAIWSQANGEISFKSNGEGQNRWVRPKVQNSLYAQHVHRHLAAIITRPSLARGSRGRVFVEGARAETNTILYSGPGKNQQVEGMSIRLAELETPARPLGYPKNLVPEAFNAFDLDLVSLTTSGKLQQSDELILMGRLLGGACSAGLITFSISWKAENTKKIPISGPSAGTRWSEFELRFFFHEEEKKWKVEPAAIDHNGERETQKAIPVDNLKDMRMGVFKVDSIDGVKGEFWCDCSLRILGGKDKSAALVGLFSQGWQTLRAVNDGLGNRPEAQSRLVALSDEIPITVIS